jgi:hypothetical protein
VHVEHLHPDCRLAVFDEIPIRHLIRPSFRHASKGRSKAPLSSVAMALLFCLRFWLAVMLPLQSRCLSMTCARCSTWTSGSPVLSSCLFPPGSVFLVSTKYMGHKELLPRC